MTAKLKRVHFANNAFTEPPYTACGELEERGDYRSDLELVDCKNCRKHPVYLRKLMKAAAAWEALPDRLKAVGLDITLPRLRAQQGETL